MISRQLSFYQWMSSDGQGMPEYELLEELAVAVESAATYTEALQETIRRICETTEWAYGESWVPDRRDTVLRPGTAWYATIAEGEAFHRASETFQFAPGEGLPGRVWKSVEPEWIADAADESEGTFVRTEQAANLDLHAAFAVPIVADRRVVAVLVFFMAEARPEDRRLVSLVSTLTVFGRLFVHKQRAAATEERRAQLEATLEESPVGIAVFTPDLTVTYLNDHGERQLGFDEAGLDELAARPSDLGLVDRDGRDISADESPLVQVIDTRRPVFDRWLGVPDEDGETRWISLSAAPIVDPSGDVDQVVVTFQDVGDRVAQLRKLEAQSRRLDEFATALSHDLRSPLAVAEGYLTLAREEHDSEPLERVAAAHARIGELIEDVLELARAGRVVTDREHVFLSDVAETAWQIAGDDSARLVVESSLGAVLADRSRLQELLENLYRNCLEHGVTPEPAATADTIDESDDDEPTGTSVTVWVRPTEAGFAVDDDGPGIDESVRPHVFEVGYTGGEGTGLGMAIVRNIAEAHGWTVDVGESPAGGARIEVRTDPDLGE